MLSKYEKNQAVLHQNYDRWKTTPPDDYDEMAEEYAAEHPGEIEFLRSNYLTDEDFKLDSRIEGSND
jgi:hypothetical protein